MPLDRTWFNSLVDETTPGTGTIWDKAAVDALMDDIDTALAALSGGGPTEQTTTSTGTQNNFSLSAGFTLLRCNNASPLTLTGFTVGGVAPTAGQRAIIHNVGSSTVKVPSQDVGSTAAHRAICPSTQGQIIGANGRMEIVYDDTTDRWRLSLLEPGATITWTPVLGGSGGTSGQTYTTQSGTYVQRGQQLFATFNIVLSAKGTITGALQLQGIPLTMVAAPQQAVVTYWETWVTGLTYLAGIRGGSTVITLYGTTGTATTIPSFTTSDIGNTSGIVGCLQLTID